MFVLSSFLSFFDSVVRVLIFVRRINRRRRTKNEPIIGTDAFCWPLIRANRTKLQINHTQRRFFLMINEFSTMNSSIYRPFGFSFIIQFNSSLVNKEKREKKTGVQGQHIRILVHELARTDINDENRSKPLTCTIRLDLEQLII